MRLNGRTLFWGALGLFISIALPKLFWGFFAVAFLLDFKETK